MTTTPEKMSCGDSTVAADAESRKLIRGTTLLTAGRMIAIVLNFFVQILTVRCLMKADYGAFEYGISIASMGTSLAVFGLGRAVNRFAPMFYERREFGRMAGTIVLALGSVAALGTGIVLLIFAGEAFISTSLVQDPRSHTMLLILILLTPLRALDSIFEELFAALASPGALFFRRHLLGPLLKLMAVLPLLFVRSDGRLLAVLYVVSGILGTACSAAVLYSLLRKADLLKYFRKDSLKLPARQMFSFSFALLSADILVIVRSSFVTLVLEFCHGALAVASYRAVLPVARLNIFVADSFRYLFSPMTSRLVARGDMASIDRVYWRSMTWTAIATFPLFLTCIGLADLVTVTLFGHEYSDSATILRLLATGFYVGAVVSFNYEVLKAHGHIGRMFFTDLITVVAAILLNLLCVPLWGATGGALATAIVLLIRPIGNQISIFRLGLLREIDWGCLRLFLLMIQMTVISWLLPMLTGDRLTDQVCVTLIGSVIVVLAGLPTLELDTTFPELLRLRLFRRLTSVKGIKA